MAVTFDQAKRCPKCDNPGEQDVVRNGPDYKLYTFICRNEACAWFGTGWVVQRMDDGTIPEREPSREKSFPAIPGMTQEKAIKSLKQTAKDEERGLRGR